MKRVLVMPNSETGTVTVSPAFLMFVSASARVSAVRLSLLTRAGPRYTDRQDERCTREGVLGCIPRGGMATMVPGRVVQGSLPPLLVYTSPPSLVGEPITDINPLSSLEGEPITDINPLS